MTTPVPISAKGWFWRISAIGCLVFCGGFLVLTAIYQAWINNQPNGAPEIASIATEIVIVFWGGLALIAVAVFYLVLSIRHDKLAWHAARQRNS